MGVGRGQASCGQRCSTLTCHPTSERLQTPSWSIMTRCSAPSHAAVKHDVLSIMCEERFFLWIAGFHPSDLLTVLTLQLELEPQSLAEEQAEAVS